MSLCVSFVENQSEILKNNMICTENISGMFSSLICANIFINKTEIQLYLTLLAYLSGK